MTIVFHKQPLIKFRINDRGGIRTHGAFQLKTFQEFHHHPLDHPAIFNFKTKNILSDEGGTRIHTPNKCSVTRRLAIFCLTS